MVEFVELYVRLVACPFQRWLSPCRYHAFDNTRKETEENTQVPELMEKVEEMITDNQGLAGFVKVKTLMI